MRLTNNLRALYHTIKNNQPIVSRDICSITGYPSMTIQDYLTTLFKNGFVTREKVKERHFYVYLYSVIDADVEPAEFIYKNRLAATNNRSTEKYPDGITIIGNKTIHRCREKSPGSNKGTGQRAWVNHGCFASSEAI